MKNNSNEEFDRLLREKMRGMEVSPPAFKPTRLKPYPLYFKYAATAVLLLLPLLWESSHLNNKVADLPSSLNTELPAQARKIAHIPASGHSPQRSAISENEKGNAKQAERTTNKIEALTPKSEIPQSQSVGQVSLPAAQNAAVATQIVEEPKLALSKAEAGGFEGLSHDLVRRPIPPQVQGEEIYNIGEPPASKAAIPGIAKDKGKSQGFPVKIAFVGTQSLHGLSWVINQNTYGLYDSKIANSSSGIISRFGTQLGIQLQQGTYLVLGANYLAKQQHSYLLNVRNQEIEQRLSLVYHQIPVLVQRQHRAVFSSNPRWTAHWETGLQYARLLSARLKFGGDDASTYQRFQEHELSLLAGYSVEYQAAPKWSFKAGVRGRIGSGINAPKWLVKGDRHAQSHNANLSAVLALRYWFKAR